MGQRWQDDGTPSGEIDRHVGRRLREIRKLRGIPVEDLAAAVGISPRRFARYESCDSPMGIGVLYTISECIGVPVTIFFPVSGRVGGNRSDSAAKLAELIDLFEAISNPHLQRALVETSRLLKAGTGAVEGPGTALALSRAAVASGNAKPSAAARIGRQASRVPQARREQGANPVVCVLR